MLREKLKSTNMAKGDSAASYLTKVSQIKDELATIGEAVNEIELVRKTLNGLTEQWDILVRGVVAQEKLPDWERLWDDFTQEELQVGNSHASQPKIEDEENLSLAGKGKFRGKKGPYGGQPSKGEKRKYFNKNQMCCLSQTMTLCQSVPKQEEGKQEVTDGSINFS